MPPKHDYDEGGAMYPPAPFWMLDKLMQELAARFNVTATLPEPEPHAPGTYALGLCAMGQCETCGKWLLSGVDDWRPIPRKGWHCAEHATWDGKKVDHAEWVANRRALKADATQSRKGSGE